MAAVLCGLLAMPTWSVAEVAQPVAAVQQAGTESQSPQTSAGAPREATTPPAAEQGAPPVDATKLGVSLSRIRRELGQLPTSSERSGEDPMRLEFVVQVFGETPRIDLLRDFPLVGPTPHGAPTHQEVLDFLTPQAYRSPPFPILALASWAAQQLWQKSKKQRCEEEIATYRALVMQGVPVAAPRCTQ
ncbi:MAG: hypothetical protein ACT4QD_02105 [Acidobacteriota bacterium]